MTTNYALFRRNKFILRQVFSCDAILVFAFLCGKSLELVASVNLLGQLPVNFFGRLTM